MFFFTKSRRFHKFQFVRRLRREEAAAGDQNRRRKTAFPMSRRPAGSDRYSRCQSPNRNGRYNQNFGLNLRGRTPFTPHFRLRIGPPPVTLEIVGISGIVREPPGLAGVLRAIPTPPMEQGRRTRSAPADWPCHADTPARSPAPALADRRLKEQKNLHPSGTTPWRLPPTTGLPAAGCGESSLAYRCFSQRLLPQEPRANGQDPRRSRLARNA